MQRIGYATGAAVTGIIANVMGFGSGLSRETATPVAIWVFLAFVPLTALGCIAAMRVVGSLRAKTAGSG